MEYHEALPPDIDLRRPLELGEVICFRDRVVKPAFNDMWTRNTVDDAEVGDIFALGKNIVKPDGLVQNFTVDAYFSPYEEEAEGEETQYGNDLIMRIGVSDCKHPAELLTPEITTVMKNPLDDDSTLRGLLSDDLAAWAITYYFFDRSSDDDPFSIEHWIEVRNRQQEYVWSCKIEYVDELPTDNDEPEEDLEQPVIYKQAPVLGIESPERTLTLIDCYQIGAALAHLGVPLKLIDQEFST